MCCIFIQSLTCAWNNRIRCIRTLIMDRHTYVWIFYVRISEICQPFFFSLDTRKSGKNSAVPQKYSDICVSSALFWRRNNCIDNLNLVLNETPLIPIILTRCTDIHSPEVLIAETGNAAVHLYTFFTESSLIEQMDLQWISKKNDRQKDKTKHCQLQVVNFNVHDHDQLKCKWWWLRINHCVWFQSKFVMNANGPQ